VYAKKYDFIGGNEMMAFNQLHGIVYNKPSGVDFTQ
jgi:hypothetical protein